MQHDDNSRHRMHDLDLVRDGSVIGAVEVTAAADAESIALWNVVQRPDGRWIDPNLVGGWMVALHPSARVKQLRRDLPTLLAELEGCGIQEIGNDHRHRRDPYRQEAERLGVAFAHQSDSDFPGSIYFTIRLPILRMAGFVADAGDALAEWASRWIAEPGQADNLRKLRDSGRPCPATATPQARVRTGACPPDYAKETRRRQ
ncbi:hypothetical protein [Micromonospora rubida]